MFPSSLPGTIEAAIDCKNENSRDHP
jgi:hypothetical protein